MNRKIKLFVSISCICILISFSNLTYSIYTQRYETNQTIIAAPWEVDTSVMYQNHSVDGQVFKNFKPGDIKENLIKLENNNSYKTKFTLEIETKEKLFENENITMSINTIGTNNDNKNLINDFNKIEKSEEEMIYFYEVELNPNTEVWIKLDIAWDKNDENYMNYQGEVGELTYKAKVEQVVQ